MKPFILFLLSFLSFAISLQAQKNCLNENSIKALDATWENAQLVSDLGVLETLLADEFIWVHNHASLIDNKAAVLKRAENALAQNKKNANSRTTTEISVIIKENTAIVTGYTIVDRSPAITNYHFMRTYIKLKGKCYLLANHTMAVPEE